MYILSIIVFLIIFSVIVLIHELGHFASARRHGVKVEEFGLGLPPKAKTLWKDKKDCEYTLNWIPFGGFIKMEGEDEANEKVIKTKGSFANKSILARMEIILAGVIMNFLLALVILTVLFTIGTKPILLNIESVEENIEKGLIILDEGLPIIEVQEGPAKEAGLLKDDIVLEINDIKIGNSEQIIELQKPNTVSKYKILREKEGVGEEIFFNIKANEEGKIATVFSSMPSFKEIKNISFPVHKAFLYSLKTSGDIAKVTVEAFKNLVVRIITKAEVPANVSGPVGIFSMTHEIVSKGNIDALFKFVALLSLSLAIMNVLPIPALDGGRFIFLLIEAIIRKPIKPSWEARIHSVSFILLLLLIFVVTGHDIYRIIIGS